MTLILELTETQQARLQEFVKRYGTNPEALFLEWLDSLPVEPGSETDVPQRIAGLHEGNILYMAPDFDAELPDSFWFPEETTEKAKFHDGNF